MAGIQSYLSAPIWLLLVVLTGSGAVHATAAVIVPLLGVLAALLVPKLAALLARRDLRRYHWRRRMVIARPVARACADHPVCPHQHGAAHGVCAVRVVGAGAGLGALWSGGQSPAPARAGRTWGSGWSLWRLSPCRKR
jgi:hypothetical protein